MEVVVFDIRTHAEHTVKVDVTLQTDSAICDYTAKELQYIRNIGVKAPHLYKRTYQGKIDIPVGTRIKCHICVPRLWGEPELSVFDLSKFRCMKTIEVGNNASTYSDPGKYCHSYIHTLGVTAGDIIVHVYGQCIRFEFNVSNFYYDVINSIFKLLVEHK